MVGVSCNTKPTEKKYFDIPGYFKTEIGYVKSNYNNLSKLAVYNDDTSRLELKVADVNWNKEWAIFLESDINKPIYYANMSESDFGEYSSKSDKLSIQSVVLNYGKNIDGIPTNEVVGVELTIVKGNLISSTHIAAGYSRNSKYTIKGKQEIRYMNVVNSFIVEGSFH